MQSHLIEVKYLGPTNYKGSRVKITNYDLSHRNNNKPKSIFISYNYELNDINDMVLNHIKKSGVKLELVTYNNRCPDKNVMLFKWNFDELCKLFKVSLKDEV